VRPENATEDKGVHHKADILITEDKVEAE